MAEKLGLYIHIPFCRSKCDYCDFYSLAGREDQMDRYQKALLAHLKEQGLDGLECYYPRHSPEMVAQYLELAKKYGLCVSAGSDFHGERVRPDTCLRPISLDTAWLGV